MEEKSADFGNLPKLVMVLIFKELEARARFEDFSSLASASKKWNEASTRLYLKDEGIHGPLSEDIIKAVTYDEMLSILPNCCCFTGSKMIKKRIPSISD